VVAILGAFEGNHRIRDVGCNRLIASADDRSRRFGNGGAQRVGVHVSILSRGCVVAATPTVLVQ
jgi:hypothetical protein